MTTLSLLEMGALKPSSPLQQPTSSTTSSSNSSAAAPPPPSPTPSRPAHKPSIIQESPTPTTFIQADLSSFKQVVQTLTGLPERATSARKPASVDLPLRGNLPTFKKASSPSKLLERRHKNARSLKLAEPDFVFCSRSSAGGASSPVPLSPSALLDLTQLSLSPVTPLISEAAATAEEKAIAGKGFYLHPTTPRGNGESAELPRLLPLFPVTSPRGSLPYPS